LTLIILGIATVLGNSDIPLVFIVDFFCKKLFKLKQVFHKNREFFEKNVVI
jgi:hypothetical protein